MGSFFVLKEHDRTWKTAETDCQFQLNLLLRYFQHVHSRNQIRLT
jgi:hypothetical protein